VPRLTSRDYKKTRSNGLNVARCREFGTGLGVGLAVAVLVFAVMSQRQRNAEPVTPRPEPRAVAAGEAVAAEPDESSQQYDFYEMLPKFEVVVPEKERDVKRDLPAAPVERPGVYVLQAGSYRNVKDADRVRSQLSLQGIDAKVQRVAVDTDEWHRVRIGPIADLKELNRVRDRLRSADLDALVIRVGD